MITMTNDNAKTMHINRVKHVYLALVSLLCLLSMCKSDTVENPPPLTTTSASTNRTNETLVPPASPILDINKVAEGGQITVQQPSEGTTHMGREHVIEHNITLHNKTSADLSLKKTAVQDPTLPSGKDIYSGYDVAEKNDDKQSVPKKGVEFPEISPNVTKSLNITSTNTTTTIKPKTTIKVRPKKPTITEATDDDPKSSIMSNATRKLPHPDIPSIEMVTENQKQHQADYIVPIVAVILSVPLVAIIISVLYKRGSEWWQHRHYRRMDFLIEGMYNN